MDRINSTELQYSSVSVAPYQLLHYKTGEYNLHRFSRYDNDYSAQELEFIKRFIPKNATSRGLEVKMNRLCLLWEEYIPSLFGGSL